MLRLLATAATEARSSVASVAERAVEMTLSFACQPGTCVLAGPGFLYACDAEQAQERGLTLSEVDIIGSWEGEKVFIACAGWGSSCSIGDGLSGPSTDFGIGASTLALRVDADSSSSDAMDAAALWRVSVNEPSSCPSARRHQVSQQVQALSERLSSHESGGCSGVGLSRSRCNKRMFRSTFLLEEE
ncbi:hypothetical protein KC328_g117 [Hortaea werneckii]|nr:hypothetical protein KC328_g117 [Hortaea werneckii]